MIFCNCVYAFFFYSSNAFALPTCAFLNVHRAPSHDDVMCSKDATISHRDGKFRSLLGKGTFGCVYGECDSERCYAVKEYTDDFQGGLSVHYIKEIIALHSFRESERVVRIVDSNSSPRLHIRMLRECISLDRILRHHDKSIDELEAWRVMLVDALHELHHRGAIHRDIKPANILLCHDDRLRLCDFGASIFVYREDQMLETNVCTYPYAAPEVLEDGTYNESCDVWSVGVVIMDLYFRAVTYMPPDRDAVKSPLGVHRWIMCTHANNISKLPLPQWCDMMKMDSSDRRPKTSWQFVSPPKVGNLTSKPWRRCGVTELKRNSAFNYMAFMVHAEKRNVSGFVLHVAISMLHSFVQTKDAERALNHANLTRFAHAAVVLANKFIGHVPLAFRHASRIYELRVLFSLISNDTRIFDLVDIHHLPRGIRQIIKHGD